MKFDVLSVFPEFFDVLGLSLLGKAQEKGIIDVAVHDLRDWAHDVHRTVDDAPFGGGAGMVMKPDVWAEAIDALTQRKEANPAAPDLTEVGMARGSVAPFVLAIPTPSGMPLQQKQCEELAQLGQRIVIACGRYEGIDARVAEYYQAQMGVNVLEYSLGDYVLNGGEVAAVALIEAVSRLLPGMMGNPESLAEESHGEAGLLEYPEYTRPASFRGFAVPEVLSSGNHQAIARWRKDQALHKTAVRRPDMIARLAPSTLDKKDLAALTREGWFAGINPDRSRDELLTRVIFRSARQNETQALSALAARTFPDAAPSYISEADILAFITQHLRPENFTQILADSERSLIMVAERLESNGRPTGELCGYTWVTIPEGSGVAGSEAGAPADFVTADGVARSGPMLYLEKAYLDRKWRGSGMFAQLLHATLANTRERLAARAEPPASPYIWLGTNPANKRAIRAYRRYGFEMSGKREFYVGEQLNNDVTMTLRLDMAQ